MLRIAVEELCKFLRGEVGTVPRLYMQLLTSHGYVKNPVYDPTGKILREAPLTIVGRNLPPLKRAVEDAKQQKLVVVSSAKERAAIKKKRLAHEAKVKRIADRRLKEQGRKEQEASAESRQIMRERRRKRPT